MDSDKSIIELAKQAGFSVKNFKPPVITAQHSNGSWIGIDDELASFATLVRAQALEEAAGVCDELNQGLRIQPTRDEFTAAIRALKETK